MELLNTLAKVKTWQDSVNPEIIASLRGENRQYSKLSRLKVERQIGRLEACGNFLVLRDWLEHEGETTLSAANFCKNHVLCRTCAIRRSAKAIAAYQAKIEHLMRENEGLKLVMITLTLKNTENLEEGVNRIRKAIGRMMADRRRHLNDPRNPANEWNKVQGSIKAMEATNKGKGWHPHFHVLCLVSDWIDQPKLSREWKAYTGDSYVVDVRKLETLESGLYEVMKYVTKFSDLQPSQIADLHLVLVGKRLIDPQGLLRGVRVPDTLTDEDLSGPYVEYYAAWTRKGWSIFDLVRGHDSIPDDFPHSTPYPIPA